MDTSEKSFASAAETSKLLITLATGVIAFCVTLLNPEVGKQTAMVPATIGQKIVLAASWFALFLCAGFGVWVQLSITHVLSEAAARPANVGIAKPVSVWNKKIRFPYLLQLCAFGAGMGLLVIYGGCKLFR